jgi:histone H4
MASVRTPAAARHFKRDHTDPLMGLTRSALRRMAYRAGCKRLDNKTYDLLRRIVDVYVTGILKETIIETHHARRRTLTRGDLTHTLRRHGEKKSYGTD